MESETEKPKHAWGLRLRDRMQELDGMSVPALAKLIIDQRVDRKRLKVSEAELAKLVKSTAESLSKYVTGKVGQPRGEMLGDIAHAIDVPISYLRDDPIRDPHDDSVRNFASNAEHPNVFRAPPEFLKSSSEIINAPAFEVRRASLPIRGRIMAGREGVLSFSGDDVVGTIEAPPRLADVPDAYAVYVTGHSMEPVYRPGFVLCVHPHQPPNRDDDVVVQISTDGGASVEGFVKRFVSMDERFLIVAQFNPAKKIKFHRKNVWAVHRVLWSGPPY
jgi:transcriptional regulator with XRE-family HTH domain